MPSDDFAGDKKAPMVSPLARVEKKFIQATVGKVPGWIGSHHLTLLTLFWSGGMLLFGYLAKAYDNLHWFWGASVMLFLQWFTDSFDGAVGRLRDSGLIKWGYYMDHLLDFVFMWCVPVSYVFVISPDKQWMVFTIAFLYGALMVNSFLEFSVTNSFKITYLGMGPTEIRLAFIVVNAFLIFKGPGFLEVALPWMIGILGIGLVIVIYATGKLVWKIDMDQRDAGV
jgi:phosphatidylglycerophosphate synthase